MIAQDTHVSVAAIMMVMIHLMMVNFIYQTILMCQALRKAQDEHYLKSLPCPHKFIYYYINSTDKEIDTQDIMY